MKEQFARFWQQRTPREKGFLSLLTVAVVVIGVVPAVLSPIQEAFSDQSERMAKLREAYEATPDMLARYTKLVARRKEVENFYKGANLSSDPMNHLETLLKDVAQAGGTYNVTPKPGVPLTGKYAHKSFAVNFQTTSYENLTAFLRALTGGSQPMLLSEIKLDKPATSHLINVSLVVSGFEVVK